VDDEPGMLHLKRIGQRLPIIFLTGQGDIPMSVRAIKAGCRTSSMFFGTLCAC
jgi:DNA-binding NtrC family response regulator